MRFNCFEIVNFITFKIMYLKMIFLIDNFFDNILKIPVV